MDAREAMIFSELNYFTALFIKLYFEMQTEK